MYACTRRKRLYPLSYATHNPIPVPYVLPLGIRDCLEFLVGGWGLAGGLGPPRNALAQANPRDWFQSQAPPRFEPRPFQHTAPIA